MLALTRPLPSPATAEIVPPYWSPAPRAETAPQAGVAPSVRPELAALDQMFGYYRPEA